MKNLIIALLLAVSPLSVTKAAGMAPYACGTMCLASMSSFCPTCYPMTSPMTMPWGAPSPWWWNSGPMMYNNFYSPGPWSYGPQWPGIMPNYYPGTGQVYAAKPNLYIEGAEGTPVTVKLKLLEPGANWLAAVPAHGTQGWSGTLDALSRIKTSEGVYNYLYSDYRAHGTRFQDQEGFCASRNQVIEKMALTLKQASFNGREIADFLDFWSVKLPNSKQFCVYPQDERQLNTASALEVTPKPAAVRRLLFMVQVEEGLKSNGQKFTTAPKKAWSPPALRMPASKKDGIVVREWGVGFFAAKP